MSKLTIDRCLIQLKRLGRTVTAKELNECLASTSTRAIATTLRKPVKDGRVKRTFRKGVAHYRFVRMSPWVRLGTS